MRLVKFPTITLTLTEPAKNGGVPLVIPQTAQDLMLIALNTFVDPAGNPRGPTAEDIEKVLPLRAKIREAGIDGVLLEEPEWRLLCDAVKVQRWPWSHEDVVKVCHAVTLAEEQEVVVKEPSRKDGTDRADRERAKTS